MNSIEKVDFKEKEIKNEIDKLLAKYGKGRLEKILQNTGINLGSTPSISYENYFIGDAFLEFENSVISPFKTYAASTKVTYVSEMQQYEKKCGKMLVEEALKPSRLAEYINSNKSPSTRNKKRSFFRSFIRFLGKEKIKNDLFMALMSRSGVLRIERILDDIPRKYKKEQLLRIFELVKFTTHGYRNFTILSVLLATGIRLDEMKFQIKDVDFDQKIILVRPKGDKSQKSPRMMNTELADILIWYLDIAYGHIKGKISIDEYKNLDVFDISTSSIKYMVHSLVVKCKEEGIIPSDKRMSVHSFRHTFATNALKMGFLLSEISVFLGHSNLNSTAIYAKVDKEQLAKQMDKFILNKHFTEE